MSVMVTKAATATTATATPASVVQDSGTSTIAVAVTAPGYVPTGSVSAPCQGAIELTTGALVNGQVYAHRSDRSPPPGDKVIEVRYAGDGNAMASSTTVTITVTAKPGDPQPIATTVSGTTTPITYGKAGSVAITVAPSGGHRPGRAAQRRDQPGHRQPRGRQPAEPSPYRPRRSRSGRTRSSCATSARARTTRRRTPSP